MKHIKRLNIIYILFIISYLKFYANCYTCLDDCKRVGNECVFKNAYLTGSFCSTDCRPNLYFKDSEKCYTCKDNNGAYYYFPYQITTTCKRLGNVCNTYPYHNKNINGTNQCVIACGPDYYEMGGYCYSDCVGGNRKEVDSSVKKCECRYLYYMSGINPICLDENKYCESYHHSYNMDTRECSNETSCPQKYFILHREGDSEDFYRCSKSCLKDEYLSSATSNQCVTSCTNYFYVDKYTKQKICTSSCLSGYVLGDNNECIEKDNCKYLNNGLSDLKNCLDNCGSYFVTYESDGYKYCSKTCDSSTPYIPENDDKICINTCPSSFYKEVSVNGYTQKKCVSLTTALTCYYQGTGNRLCLTQCPSTGNKYHNVGSYECKSSCSSPFAYHKDDGIICYESCDLIPDLGKSYIITSDSSGNICGCLLYAEQSGKNVCYHKEEECYAADYQRKLGNKCIKENDCKFKAEGETSSGFLKKCFSSITDCKNNNYPYYYSTDGGASATCWASCPDYIYASTSNQPIAISGSSCVPKCTGTYIYYSTNSKICKTKCDVGEFINPTSTTIGIECLSSCSTNYIGENNECYSSCGTLYTIAKGSINQKNKCVANCINYGKYYDSQDTTRTCKDSCPSGQFYNSENQCLTSCSDSTNVKLAEKYDYVNPALPAYPCLTSDQITNLYYYTDTQTKVYSTCDIFDTSSSRIICSYCDGTSQYVYNNYCVTECPLEAPYFREESKTFSLTNGAVKTIKNCLSNCSSSEKIVEYSNECVTNCPNGHTSNNNKCFKKCQSPNQYFNPITNQCGNVNECTKYYEKSSITGNYICKSTCSVTNKYLNGTECVSKCTSPKNCVGLNNECKDGCSNDDGKYKLAIENSMIKCLFSCPAVNYIFYVEGQFQCLDKCPGSTDYFVIETTANNYECRTSCPYDYPYYLKSKKNTTRNYYACTKSFPCSDNQYFYKGVCYSSCINTPDSTNFVERRICVNSCNRTEGYTYTKTIENGITECKKNCDNDEYIIGDVCYDNCPDTAYNIGKDKQCYRYCSDSGVGTKFYLFSNPSGYKIYKCVESCPPDFPLLDKGTNECVKTCNSTQYISSEENICYNTNCLSSPVNQFTLDYGSTKKINLL